MLIKKQNDNGAIERRHRRPFWLGNVGNFQSSDEANPIATFQPDILIPAQFSATLKKHRYLEPERALMLAILQDAVICFQDNLFATKKPKRLLYEEAERWFFDCSTREVFSFENVCESLGIDPDYLRSGLMRWKSAALTGRRSTRRAS